MIKSFYIPGGWPISFYCPLFFFFLAMQIQSIFLEPPIHYVFIQVKGSLPAFQQDKRGAPRGSSSLHQDPSET